jgi:hypothetical protein
VSAAPVHFEDGDARLTAYQRSFTHLVYAVCGTDLGDDGTPGKCLAFWSRDPDAVTCGACLARLDTRDANGRMPL